jgi:hypothetical protein
VHELLGLANAPLESELKPTVPVGVLAVPVSVSETVAVHVDAEPTTTGFGAHDTPVEVERVLTVSRVVPELIPWAPSPP